MGQCPSWCLAPNPKSGGWWWIGEHHSMFATATANDRMLSAPFFQHWWTMTEQRQQQQQRQRQRQRQQQQQQQQQQRQRRRRDRILPQHLVPGTTDACHFSRDRESWTDIDTRNARWEKVLLQIPEADRERLVDTCSESLPPSMDSVDGLALVSVLATVGLLSLLGEMVDISKHSRCTAPGWSYGLSNSGNSGNNGNSGSNGNHNHNNHNNNNTNNNTNKRHSPGRIERLSLGGSRYYFDGDRDEDPFDLPPGIAHLDRLRELIVVNCRSLPQSLHTLPVLEKLMWIRCDFGDRDGAINTNTNTNTNNTNTNNTNTNTNTNHTSGNDGICLDFELELRSVATIAIVECLSVGSRDWFAWMATSLPKLRCLQYGCLQVHETDALLRALLSSPRYCCCCHRNSFREGLRALVLDACQITDGHLETLLLEVLPGFPSVTHLHLSRNRIRSLKRVAKRLASTPKKQRRAVSLREVSFRDNPCVDHLRDDSSETAALATVLEALDTIGCLGACSVGEFGPDVEYALRINRAGKRLLETNENDDHAGRLPLSAWPLLLERAVDATATAATATATTTTATTTATAAATQEADVRRSESSHWEDGKTNATGIYYLLRNAPFVLLGTRT